MVNKGKTHPKLARKSIDRPSGGLGRKETMIGMVQFWARMMNKGKFGWEREREGHIWLDKGKGRPHLVQIQARMVNKGKTHKKLARKSINRPSGGLGKIQTRLGLVQFWARMMNKGKWAGQVKG